MVLNNRVVGPNKSVIVGKINDRAALYPNGPLLLVMICT